MGWLRARECGRLCRLQSVSIASVSLVLTEHALERGPAGLQSACFPGKTEQCEVVTEVRDKQRTLSNFEICNPKPHTFFPFLFPKAKSSLTAGIWQGNSRESTCEKYASHKGFLFSLPLQFKLPLQSWVWELVTRIPELGRWRQEHPQLQVKFKVSLNCMRP